MQFPKLTIHQADEIYRKAKTLSSLHKLRLGQALMHELPYDVYQCVTDSEFDMFYFEDDEVTETFFWNNFV